VNFSFGSIVVQFRRRARNASVALTTLETVDRLVDDLERPRLRPVEAPQETLRFSRRRALLGSLVAIVTGVVGAKIVGGTNHNRDALTVEPIALVLPSCVVVGLASLAPAS